MNYANLICKHFSIPNNEIIIRSIKLKQKFSYYEFIEAIINFGSTASIELNLQIPKRTISRAFERLRNFGIPKLVGGNQTYKFFLLFNINFKECFSCDNIKSLDNFSIDNYNSTGYNSLCKNCAAIKHNIYYENNKDVYNQKTTKRQRNLDRALTKEEIDFIFKRDNNQCKICNISNLDHEINFGTRLHIDHIISISKGGLTTVENSQLLCIQCNSSKSNK